MGGCSTNEEPMFFLSLLLRPPLPSLTFPSFPLCLSTALSPSLSLFLSLTRSPVSLVLSLSLLLLPVSLSLGRFRFLLREDKSEACPWSSNSRLSKASPTRTDGDLHHFTQSLFALQPRRRRLAAAGALHHGHVRARRSLGGAQFLRQAGQRCASQHGNASTNRRGTTRARLSLLLLGLKYVLIDERQVGLSDLCKSSGYAASTLRSMELTWLSLYSLS